MSDVLDTPEGRALRRVAQDAWDDANEFNAGDDPNVSGGIEGIVRAVLAATDDQGESIVVLRSEMDEANRRLSWIVAEADDILRDRYYRLVQAEVSSDDA